jgi:hypothetical protein
LPVSASCPRCIDSSPNVGDALSQVRKSHSFQI